MSKIFKSIKAKMVFFFSFSLIFATILQVIFVSAFTEIVYIKQRETEIKQLFSDLSNDYSNDYDDIYDTVSRYEDELNVRIFIFDEDGTIIYQTLAYKLDLSLLPLLGLQQDGSFQVTFSDEPTVDVLGSYRNNAQTIALRGRIEGNDFTHYIILETPLASIHESVSTVTGFIIYSSVAALVLGCLMIFYFAIKLSNPISEINNVATAVTNLDFSKRVKVTGRKGEIHDLARNINTMSEQIEKMINELKIANIELQKDNDLQKQVDSMRREFVANVSHELKTPLSILQGYSEILKNDTQGIDKDFYYDVIIDESNHMNELVNRLLNVTSLENGLTKLDYEKFDLSELINKTLSKTEVLSEDIKIVSITPENCFVFADKLFIGQVITNYLSNALTYAKSKIIIEVVNEDHHYVVNVSNDGAPISEPDRIWHSFYREDKARTRSKEKNFGLGLYIVKTIISAHNGDYGVYNSDNGVTFYFTLDKNSDII